MSTNLRKQSRLGAALQVARRTAKLTQTELAGRTNLSRAAVIKAEAGQGRLNILASLATQVGMAIGGRGLPPGGASIGTKLAALRRTRAFSQRAAAKLAGISVPTLAAIEAGQANVSVAAVEALASALGASLRLMPVDEVTGSSNYDAWTTPADLAEAMADAVGGKFDIDAASPGAKVSPIPARTHYTAAVDGLSQRWSGTVWCNPPYGAALKQWVPKMHGEVEAGHARMVVALLPSYTGRAWWNPHVMEADLVWYIRGRLRFGGAKNSAAFDSVIVVWGGNAKDHQRIKAALSRWEAQRSGRRERLAA